MNTSNTTQQNEDDLDTFIKMIHAEFRNNWEYSKTREYAKTRDYLIGKGWVEGSPTFFTKGDKTMRVKARTADDETDGG